MDPDNCSVTCSVIAEWTNSQGSIQKKANHRTATLRLLRNDLRELFVEMRAEKANLVAKLSLKSISVFNKFMGDGKATIKFPEQNCTLFLSNAPPTQLTSFLKTIYVKITGQMENTAKIPLREKLLSNKSLGGNYQEISPATTSEINKAKEKAINVSRATVTTPSPSTAKKRKRLGENTPHKIPVAKKLYENPTVGQINEEQSKILDAVLKGQNIFFTGSAGTGKSFLLKRIIAALPPNVTMATASTGVAACHIGGITLHQFAGIGLGTATLERCFNLASRNSAIWRKTKHLVIDEISMIEGDYFDKIEAVARYIRRNERPFGGIQLILCGDFFQLPPVAKRDSKVKFCFQSETWNKCVHFNYELQTVHRQKDPEFVKILNSIRIGRVTDEIVQTLKGTSKQQIENNGVLATRLCTHVNEAEEINEFQLNELKGESKVYVAHDSDQSMTATFNQQLPIPGKLVLKVGAQVMLLKNINIANGLVNGARGVVVRFSESVPVVQFKSGTQYVAKVEQWTLKNSSGLMVHRKQVPLKLAWAFSIHKSQGLSLDCVEMCLARVFDAGQSYVALSRAHSLQCLRVLDFNNQQVWANTTVLEFYRKFRKHLQEVEYIPLGKKPKLFK